MSREHLLEDIWSSILYLKPQTSETAEKCAEPCD